MKERRGAFSLLRGCDQSLEWIKARSSLHSKGARTPDAQRRAASRRAMSFKFEHIVFNVCTHTGGAIRRLSAAHSNDCLERCSRRGAARRGAARSVCDPLKRSVITPLWIHSGFYIPAHGKTALCSLHLNVIRDY